PVARRSHVRPRLAYLSVPARDAARLFFGGRRAPGRRGGALRDHPRVPAFAVRFHGEGFAVGRAGQGFTSGGVLLRRFELGLDARALFGGRELDGLGRGEVADARVARL